MIIEIVACSVEDCQAIERAGANRIELCSGIVAGGVTPSSGLAKACRHACSLPIMAMIRPREGGFCYSSAEFETMQREIDALATEGVSGFVFGILLPDGSIDRPRMEVLRRQVADYPVMCHRAFDVTRDPFDAIEALIDAGITRVLSSGQRREILAGLPRLQEIMDYAAGRIEVQPCEGIRSENVRQVVTQLQPKSIHLGPFKAATDLTSALGTEVHYGDHLAVDEACVRDVVRACHAE